MVRKAICSSYFYNSARLKGVGEYMNMLTAIPCNLHPSSALFGLGYVSEWRLLTPLVVLFRPSSELSLSPNPTPKERTDVRVFSVYQKERGIIFLLAAVFLHFCVSPPPSKFLLSFPVACSPFLPLVFNVKVHPGLRVLPRAGDDPQGVHAQRDGRRRRVAGRARAHVLLHQGAVVRWTFLIAFADRVLPLDSSSSLDALKSHLSYSF